MVSTLSPFFFSRYLRTLAMLTVQFLTRFLNTLKKWLSQLARHCASSLSLFLSLLRQFASGHLRLGSCGRRLFARTCFSDETLPRSQGNVAREDAPICSSFLPPPPSDDPYSRISQHSQHLRKVTATPSSLTNTTTQNGSTAKTDRCSISSLDQSLQTGEMLGSNVGRTFSDGDPLDRSSSPGPSHPSSLHGPLSGSHSRSQIYMNDVRSLVATTPRPSTTHLSIGMTHSRHSLSSQGSDQSLTTRSITGSQCGQATLRLHEGPVYYLPKHIHSSIVLQDGPPDLTTSHHVHFTVPPGSDENIPGSDIVEVHEDEPPGISTMVAKGVMRYDRCIPR
jgi:hypothetical protein